MSLLPPIILPSDMLEKLPGLRVIVPYLNSLSNTITNLLGSNENEKEFEERYTQTKIEFLKYMVQTGLAVQHHKDFAKDLREVYSSFSTQLGDRLSQERRLDKTTVLAIINANEILLDFFNLALNPNIDMSVPKYTPAIDPYLNLIVCVSTLVQATGYERNLTKLTDRCRENTWKLESYVETIEIESDPEQRAILDRVKGK